MIFIHVNVLEVATFSPAAGTLKQADEQRYFFMARGSVMECRNLFDQFSSSTNFGRCYLVLVT